MNNHLQSNTLEKGDYEEFINKKTRIEYDTKDKNKFRLLIFRLKGNFLSKNNTQFKNYKGEN